ncbi:MAG: hypothetical protein ACO1RX_08445 [Candidatus Sericytochromatia bacterium]
MKGQQLRQLLQALDVSQGELSEHLGYSRHAINKWMIRNVDIPRECVSPICAFFKRRLKLSQQKQALVVNILYLCESTRSR